jgi:lysophospholipase L1-like esterase
VLPGARLALALLAAATLDSGCGTPAREVAFVGDSLTGGWYASSIDKSYPDQLTKRVGARILARVYGPDVPDVLPGADDLPAGADHVVVEIGTNAIDRDTPTHFAQTYRTLIDAIRKREPSAHFVCLGVWWASGVIGKQGHGPADYDAVIQSTCPGKFVPLLAIFGDLHNHGPAGRSTFRGTADAFHPNDRGHAAISDAIGDLG